MEIKINYAAFDDAACALEEQLKNLDKLEAKAAALSFRDGSAQSTGHSARAMAQSCGELSAVIAEMRTLFRETESFIAAARETYQNADQTLASGY